MTFKDAFPYVITATTTKQFKEYKIQDNEPFMRRFELIYVEPLEKEKIELSLYIHLHKKFPELIAEKNIISYITENANVFDPTTSQLQAAHFLLARAVVYVTVGSFKDLETQIHNLSSKLEYMKNRFFHGESDIDLAEYNKLTAELEKANQELESKKEKLAEIKKIEDLYLKCRRQEYILAEKALQNSTDKASWLRNKAHVKILSTFIQSKKKELGLSGKIDKDLIDRIIAEKVRPLKTPEVV